MGSDFPLLQQDVALNNVRQAVYEHEAEWVLYRNARRMIAHRAMHATPAPSGAPVSEAL
ncbi:hypothetical protein D3C72_2302820 [compost metagenome]